MIEFTKLCYAIVEPRGVFEHLNFVLRLPGAYILFHKVAKGIEITKEINVK